MPSASFTKSYSDGTVLTESQLDDLRSSIEDFLNVTQIDDDNIQTAGITGSTKLVDASVSQSKLATNSVATAKIVDSAVTTAKINNSAVTTAKIADDAVTLDKVDTTVWPPGIIEAYGGTSAPTGWLLCDGSAVSRTTYSALFAIIGTAFGYGDNSTTFNLPDLGGNFLRGRDNGAGRDPDAGSRGALNTGGNTGDNVGSFQAENYLAHTHGVSAAGHTHGTITVGTGAGAGAITALSFLNSYSGTTTISATTGAASASVTTQSSGGNETRPRNVYVNYIIKT